MSACRQSVRAITAAIMAALLLLLAAIPGRVQEAAPVLLAPVEGPIGPHVTRQITRAVETAETRGAPLLILRLDTPGGLVTSTREIVKEILAAPVPVAVYVAPEGARAASAGTYILYSAHVAAMAPGTNLGAATPISMGGAPGGGAPDEESDESALEKKQVNDAVAWIRSLAELRGRNADWAEKAVREGASLTATAAREKDVIEVIAADGAALLRAIDGREITIDDRTVRLETAAATVEVITPDWRTRALGILANPNVALLLMTLGFYGLIFELSSPGLGPGIPGAISLLVGLYALNLLPLNYAALALMGIGLALIAAEAFSPGLGVPGIGGAVAFALGAALVVETDSAAYRIDWPVIAALTGLSLALVTLILGAVWRSFGRPTRASAGRMEGTPGEVIRWSGTTGRVRAHGEDWAATGPDGLSPGEAVIIARLDGLTLHVERADNPERSAP